MTARNKVATAECLARGEALEVATALDVLVRALILNGRAAQDQTLTLARHTLRTKEARLATEDADLAASLLNLGDVLAAAAEFEPAIAATERAVALREASVPPDSLGVAEALDHLGGALSAARRYDEALKALERSLHLKEKALDGADVSIARTLEEIGLVLQRKGAYDTSGTRCDGLRRSRRPRASIILTYARTLNLIAQQLWFEGQLVESRNASEQAVALAERTLATRSPYCRPVAPISCFNAGGSRRSGPVPCPEGAGSGHRRAQFRREPSRDSAVSPFARVCRAARGGVCRRAATFQTGFEHLRSALRPVA